MQTLLFLLFLSLFSITVEADTSLSEVYRQALEYDADFAAARAGQKAGKQTQIQGASLLLPNVSASYSTLSNTTDTEYGRLYSYRKSQDQSKQRTETLRLTQPLFNVERLARFRQSSAQTRYSEAVFEAARQDLIARVAEKYFNTLLAYDNIALIRAQKEAITAQKKQVEQMFKAGVGTITDIHEAQARYDLVSSQELAALNNSAIQERDLKRLTGAFPEKLAGLSETFPLNVPEPNDINLWIESARKNNPKVFQQQANYDYASQEVVRASSTFLPSVDFVITHQKAKDPNSYTELETNRSAGVQVSMTLFEGGRGVSASIESIEKKEQARQALESAIRGSELEASQYFLGVVNGVAQIKAMEQAVKSSESALKGARIGLEVGLRTSVDVLNAQQQYYQARRDLLRERYTYVMSRLRLKAAVGTLTEEDLFLIDRWLNKKS